MNDYPRMLYRPGSGPEVLWGELVDNRTVQSAHEETQAIREGWLRDPSRACLKAKSKRIWLGRLRRAGAHWQFWITSSIAVVAAIFAYMAIK